MKKILCFGDSNTWGYNPVDGSRYNRPWPVLLSENLSHCKILAKGMPGRTTRYNGTSNEKINGFEDFTRLFQQEQPDYVILSLGTNDLQNRFNCNAEDVAESLRGYVEYIGSEKVTLVVPARIEEIGFFGPMFTGGAEKSQELSKTLAQLANTLNCGIVDANNCIDPSPVDGIHWSETDHENFTVLLTEHLKNIL